MYSIISDNPTELYFKALNDLVVSGEECSPRGKLIKELRPAAIGFSNPLNRVTFLGSRRINGFFQLAESLWILSGRADAEWLSSFNINMMQFSDDGKWFNAPYGERLRTWGKNALHNVLINPLDQMADAYIKMLNDKDTRQAVMVISNPSFDNSVYTVNENGRDIACNLVVTFKIRKDKLDMTVFNRSNDLNWGTFGANLCQFSTIQETMLSWLKNSGEKEFSKLEIGTYYQITDSLHIYLDSYGAQCTTDILEYYKTHSRLGVEHQFECVKEPRMSQSSEEFDTMLATYWQRLDQYVMDDDYLGNKSNVNDLLRLVTDLHKIHVLDDYWFFAIKAMIAYRLHKVGNTKGCVELLLSLDSCQWKISLMYFMKGHVSKLCEAEPEENSELPKKWRDAIDGIIENLKDEGDIEYLHEYLDL